MQFGPYIVTDNLKPWVWQRIEEDGCVPENSLLGPRVLCRHWNQGDESFDEALMAHSLVMFKLLYDLQSELRSPAWESHNAPEWLAKIDSVVADIMAGRVEVVNMVEYKGAVTGRFNASLPNYSRPTRQMLAEYGRLRVEE